MNVLRTTLGVALGLLLLGAPALAAVAEPARVSLYEQALEPTALNKIDLLVFARLARLGIKPARVCSDGVFVRRAFLDIIGTLPTAQEACEFIGDETPGKRQVLVEQLLARGEFADYWTMRWCNLLRVKAEFPINLWPNAAQAYHRWIRASIRDNLPYDRFVRELLTGNGSNFGVGQVNFYRAMQTRDPQGIARAVALIFMGERAEQWPKERLEGLAGFFAQVGYKGTAEWKEEIVFWDPAKTNDQGRVTRRAVFPDGRAENLDPDRDPRVVFADWLITPKNPAFGRCIANRVWAWFMGRGIINEPDDIRPDNPPVNGELLDHLAKELAVAHWDMKQLFRLILSSRTYQLSSIPRSADPAAAENFAFYPVRRLEAEVLIDALNQITGTTEKYTSAIPEPFTFIPEHQRAIALPDGSITSSFLEMFGRPARDTGLESERNSRPTAGQRLHLLNSSHIQRKLEQGPGIRKILHGATAPREIVAELYLTILARYPTEPELRLVDEYARAGGRDEASLDLAWALINSAEFLHRH